MSSSLLLVAALCALSSAPETTVVLQVKRIDPPDVIALGLAPLGGIFITPETRWEVQLDVYVKGDWRKVKAVESLPPIRKRGAVFQSHISCNGFS